MTGQGELSTSASMPSLPTGVGAGGVWVLREMGGRSLSTAGRAVARPPKNEAAAVAWKASRKATLQGQLGTGNRISSVVQYPVCNRDPSNMAQGRRQHLSAEDRRILRVRIKHHMRGRSSYPDCVYMVEDRLIRGFSRSGELCNAFFCNEDFAKKLLDDAARAVEGIKSGPQSKDDADDSGSHYFGPPGHHGPFCGPQCYCLKHAAAALSLKGGRTEGWQDSFAEKSKTAATSVLASVTASRHHTH